MMFRKWVLAGVAAVASMFASPARSEAGIQVLVEELNASGTVVGTSSFFNGTPAGAVVFSQPFTYSGSQLSIVSGGALTNSHLGAAPASLSSNFGIAVLVNNPTNSLRITVTDDGYNVPSPGDGLLRNSASVSIATNAAAQVDSFSRMMSVPLTTPASSGTALADGTTIGGPTDVATDVRPDTIGSSPITTANVSNIPTQFALQQVILVSIPDGFDTPANTSFNGTAGVTALPVSAVPVPAPPALALALLALPLVGARRALRKKA
jgi:hypothetical protein